MGRKHKRHVEEDHDKKGFEALAGQCVPSWWHNMDEHQAKYASAIDYYKVILVDDKAGTSKTTTAVTKGLELLKAGKVDKIHYVRFPDKRSLGLGFLPGDDTDKEKGFMYPFFEALSECGLQPEFVEKLINQGVIETSTDIHMRGRTLDRVYLIVDEAQNGDIPSLRLVLTRIKDNGKAVVIGHTKQADNKLPKYGKAGFIPFEVYQLHMVKKPWATKCRLHKDYRGAISQWADEIEITLNELEEERLHG